ncbi:hypothetical protein AB0K64_29995 [Streptomyces sp. NPDC053741]|uniref:hypothetical protein n=1 Tax=Streptomyces TaxID=1883 RepID=UPI003428E884
MQDDRDHPRHLPGGAADPDAGSDRLRAVEVGLELGEVADEVGEEPGRGLPVVPVSVCFGSCLEVGQISRRGVGGQGEVQ